jgi:hypothetical protein
MSGLGLVLRLLVLELRLAWRRLFPARRRPASEAQFDLAIRRLARSVAASERRRREQEKWGPS